MALLDDLELAARDAAGREVGSVFFGGGTPSLFDADALARLLERARDLLTFAPGVEITLEANPGTVEHGRFADYAALGINRVSLGAQTFDDSMLRSLGRIHTAGDVARAVDEVRTAGIENFNLDLMYGLPGQELAGAIADVERAIALQPTHLSHYQLTLEPDTPSPHRGQHPFEVDEQRIDVFALRQRSAPLVRIEVAVRALAHAPRKVHVQRERRENGEADLAGNGNACGGAHRARSRSSASSRSSAWPRWLMRFFSWSPSSAAVTPRPSTTNSGS